MPAFAINFFFQQRQVKDSNDIYRRQGSFAVLASEASMKRTMSDVDASMRFNNKVDTLLKKGEPRSGGDGGLPLDGPLSEGHAGEKKDSDTKSSNSLNVSGQIDGASSSDS